MKKILAVVTIIVISGMLVFWLIFLVTGSDLAETMAITFMTTAYHFVMRETVGLVTRNVNHWDEKSWWFRQRAFETRLYDLLKVKRWKREAPTYRPGDFRIKEKSPDELIQTMCGSEAGHEIMILLSFIPILFSIAFGEMAIFVITSVLAAIADLSFVIIQRYNRPRVEKIMLRSVR